MKNLDLNKYGVQEMNENEMKTVEGGGFWGFLGTIGAIIIGFLIAGPAGAAAGAMISGVTGLPNY